jgi:hypothetical protein
MEFVEKIDRDLVWSRSELAKILGLTTAYLNSAKCRIKPNIKSLNGRVYYLKTSVEEYLAQKKANGGKIYEIVEK